MLGLASLWPSPVTASQGYALPLAVGRHATHWQLWAGRTESDERALRVWGGSTILLSDYEHDRGLLELEFRSLGPCSVTPVIWAGTAEQADGGLLASAAMPMTFQPDPRRRAARVRRASGAGGAEVVHRARVEFDQGRGAGGRLALRVVGDAASSIEITALRVLERNFVPLWNGQNLDGWEGAGEDAATCWRAADGTLECTGQRGTWLRSVREYGDFTVRLEYRLGPGGNSGVYVRVPPDGNHHGDGAGLEVQILDDLAERYRDLEPYQFTGSLYAIAAARPGTARPAGTWNTLEIRCVGQQYRVMHNGQVVVQTSALEFPALADRRVRGFLGLQNHSERVEFRHLRIRMAD